MYPKSISIVSQMYPFCDWDLISSTESSLSTYNCFDLESNNIVSIECFSKLDAPYLLDLDLSTEKEI